jgi:hypothetical protein
MPLQNQAPHGPHDLVIAHATRSYIPSRTQELVPRGDGDGDDPKRGWGLWRAESRGGGGSVWALGQTGPRPPARSAPKRAMRRAKARFLAASHPQGRKSHGRRPLVHGVRHAVHKAAICLVLGRVEQNWRPSLASSMYEGRPLPRPARGGATPVHAHA